MVSQDAKLLSAMYSASPEVDVSEVFAVPEASACRLVERIAKAALSALNHSELRPTGYAPESIVWQAEVGVKLSDIALSTGGFPKANHLDQGSTVEHVSELQNYFDAKLTSMREVNTGTVPESKLSEPVKTLTRDVKVDIALRTPHPANK